MQTPQHLFERTKHGLGLLVPCFLAVGLAQTEPAAASGANGGISGTGALSSTSSFAAGPVAGRDICATATRRAEIDHGLPDGLMLAIAQVESGRYDPELRENIAWPWTINAEGEGAHFDTRGEAVAQVSALLESGMESIDVGCMQVNLRWHPDAFASLDDGFDPAINADYAARLLNRLFARHGDWPAAIAHYHSPTAWRQADYQAKVAAAWAAQGGSFAGLPVAQAEFQAASAPRGGPTLFGGLVAAGGPGSGAIGLGGIAAPASQGTAGAGTLQPSGTAGSAGRGGAVQVETVRFFPLEPR